MIEYDSRVQGWGMVYPTNVTFFLHTPETSLRITSYIVSQLTNENGWFRDYESISRLLCMVRAIRLADKGHNRIYHIHGTLSLAEPRSWRGDSIQHYVIKFVSDLRQVGGFLRVPRFSSPIKLTATI
jgi:hypothetical protein